VVSPDTAARRGPSYGRLYGLRGGAFDRVRRRRPRDRTRSAAPGNATRASLVLSPRSCRTGGKTRSSGTRGIGLTSPKSCRCGCATTDIDVCPCPGRPVLSTSCKRRYAARRCLAIMDRHRNGGSARPGGPGGSVRLNPFHDSASRGDCPAGGSVDLPAIGIWACGGGTGRDVPRGCRRWWSPPSLICEPRFPRCDPNHGGGGMVAVGGFTPDRCTGVLSAGGSQAFPARHRSIREGTPQPVHSMGCTASCPVSFAWI
jgi:hypothetical protein